jgi:hypothetical protein
MSGAPSLVRPRPSSGASLLSAKRRTRWRRESCASTVTGRRLGAGRSMTKRVAGDGKLSKVIRINAPHEDARKSLGQDEIARLPHDGSGIDLGHVGEVTPGNKLPRRQKAGRKEPACTPTGLTAWPARRRIHVQYRTRHPSVAKSCTCSTCCHPNAGLQELCLALDRGLCRWAFSATTEHDGALLSRAVKLGVANDGSSRVHQSRFFWAGRTQGDRSSL